MRKALEDAFYDREIERMLSLAGFPLIPAARLEYRRVLRRISETDGTFLHKLISEVVDTSSACPPPAHLIEMAAAKRDGTSSQTAAVADCGLCGGSGYVTTVREVKISGIAPYAAEFAARCQCRGGGK